MTVAGGNWLSCKAHVLFQSHLFSRRTAAIIIAMSSFNFAHPHFTQCVLALQNLLVTHRQTGQFEPPCLGAPAPPPPLNPLACFQHCLAVGDAGLASFWKVRDTTDSGTETGHDRSSLGPGLPITRLAIWPLLRLCVTLLRRRVVETPMRSLSSYTRE